DTDVLEHADRNNAVELRRKLAIVLQRERDAALEACRFGALNGQRELLLRERDTHHFDVGDPSEIARKPAPARADVEHLHAGLQVELGRYEPALVDLRRFERFALVAEIGAGVEELLVEKKLVEGIAEIIVVRDVLLRLADRVRLLKALQASRNSAQHLLHGLRAEREAVDREECEERPQSRFRE